MTRFISNRILVKHASPSFNPMHGLEEPHESSFAATPPTHQDHISEGMTKPKAVNFSNSPERGIAKADHMSATFEPMAYHLGKKLNVPVPKTVVRTMPGAPSPKNNYQSNPELHSVQKRVNGIRLGDMDKSDKKEVLDNPDFHKIAMFDWMTGNSDRHANNIMYDPNEKQLHAIDNGAMAHYFNDRPHYGMDKNKNVINANANDNVQWNLQGIAKNQGTLPIPEDFKHAVLNSNPDEHKQVINQFTQHPNFEQGVKYRRGKTQNPNFYKAFGKDHAAIGEHIANHYGDRLNTLKRHFSDPNVKTMGDLYQRLYPPQLS
jgi:hypothetical protein